MQSQPLVLAGVPLLCASAALAQHAGDILLTIDSTSTIRTGHINLDGTLNLNERVFGTTLGVTFPDFTDNPGFDCLPGTFPVPSSNGFRILDALRAWNGTDFTTIPPERMQIAFSILSVETPATSMTVEGFTLTVGSNGEWHRHLEYTLFRDDGLPDNAGIYLLQLQIFSSRANLNPTPPFWLLFNEDSDQATLDAAVQWVKCNLAGECCGSADFDCDGDVGTDADIEAFFACLAGNCPPAPCTSSADFNDDGDVGTDADIEAFFRVLAGGSC